MSTDHLCLFGGAGFIGSHVADAALVAGMRVTIVDDLSTGQRAYVPSGADLVEMDMRSDQVRPLLAKLAPTIVSIHAAQKSISASVSDPSADASVNILGLLNVLSGLGSIDQVVFASSGGALATEGLFVESDMANPTSPYGISKLAGEQYVAWYAREREVACSILRYANGYGPRQHALGDCGVIPIFAANLASGQPSMLHAWDDQPQGAIRDYVHVSDLARANVMVMKVQHHGCLHLGTGVGTSTGQLYQQMATHFSSPPPLIRQPPRSGDPRRAVLGCERAWGQIGWKAEVSLAQGLEELLTEST